MLIRDIKFQGVQANNYKPANISGSGVQSLTFEGKRDDKKVDADLLRAYLLPVGRKKAELTADSSSSGSKTKMAPKRTRKPKETKAPEKQAETPKASGELKCQGPGLLSPKGYIEWSRVGWESLKSEPLDLTKASEKEIDTFMYALALAETKDTSWVKRYNATNVPEPLACYHSLVGDEAKTKCKQYLDELRAIDQGKLLDVSKPSYLDKVVIDQKTGKLNLEFTIFDTETTGVNTDPNKTFIDPKTGILTKVPVDKIVQIGAVKVGADGEVKVNTAVSQFVNPEMHIPEGATAVHHITDEMVKDKPVIDALLPDFCNKYIGDQLLVAYNAKFDIPMLNRAIAKYNDNQAIDLPDKKLSLTMDPFMLIQRIHPFVGSRKKLGEQYKFLYGKNMEGAHDALDDVKGTVDVLKYCCQYLQAHANRPLTVKDILTFQHGGKVEGLNIQLNEFGYDKTKDFKKSYRLETVGVKDFPDGNMITEKIRKELTPLIGEENSNKLACLDKKQYKGHKKFDDRIKALDLKPFEGKSVEDIHKLIDEKTVFMIQNEYVTIWMKNHKRDADNLKAGNDMPDYKLAKNVMEQRKIQDAKGSGEGLELAKALKNI